GRKALKRLRDLHARLGSTNAGERENALRKIDEWLRKYGKTWNDVPEFLHDETSPSTATTADPRDADQTVPFAGASVTPADTVRAMLQDYVTLERPEDYVASALWVIHTHVHDRFMVTPRLLLTSPVRYCGKTTLLDVLNRLVVRPERTDSITAAAI